MTELLDFLDKTYGDSKAVDLVLYPPVSPSHYSGRRERVTIPSSDSEDGQLFAKPSKSKKKKHDERKNQKEVSPSHERPARHCDTVTSSLANAINIESKRARTEEVDRV